MCFEGFFDHFFAFPQEKGNFITLTITLSMGNRKQRRDKSISPKRYCVKSKAN